MKIIIVNDFAYVNGGASQVAILDALELSRKGIEIVFFSAVGPLSKELDKVDKIETYIMDKEDILNNPNRLEAIKDGIWNIDTKKKFSMLLNKMNPKETIIHVHTLSKALSSSLVRIAIHNGFPLVYHMHDFGIACPNLGFYNYQTQQICNLNAMSFKCLCTNCDSRSFSHKMWRSARQFVQKQFGLLPKGIKHFISVSNFSHNILKPYLPKDSSIHLIHNPISVTKEDFSLRNIGDYFVFVGRLSAEKDPLIVAKAAKELNVPVMFIGDGDLKEEIQKINPEAKLLGWLENKEVMNHVRKARALIMPSRLYETQGMVVPEALACGVPVIVAETSAAVDFIIQGETGITFKTGNVNSLILKMKELLNDELAKEMSFKAYKTYWNDPFTIDKHINELINLYREILKDKVS